MNDNVIDINEWQHRCDLAIQEADGNEVAEIRVDPVELSEILQELVDRRQDAALLQDHMDNCGQWPYEGTCRHGDDDLCPALKVYISADHLAQALFSIEGGVCNTDGTWHDDIVREKFVARADQILKILLSERR